MNILILSNLFPPEVIGGAERHAAADVDRLDNRGYEVSVITTSKNGSLRHFCQERQKNVEIYRIRPANMYAPYSHQRIATWRKPIQHIVDQWNPHSYIFTQRKVKDINPDIIHIHNYSGLSKSVFSAANESDAPTVHTLHDYNALHIQPSLFADDKTIKPGPLMKLYQKYNNKIIGANVDMIIAPSQFIINKHHEEGVFTDVPTKRVPLGIDTEDLRQYESKTGNQSNYRLLYAGQLTHSKGVDVVIDAVKQIDGHDLELHILGKGPKREPLEAQARGDDRIEFHGFVSEEELARQYTVADFTVVPSRWYDNSPMVIYESYARQTPVIGADIGGIPELIDEGETGYCFEPERPAALAEVIEAHRDDADRLSENLVDVDVSLDTHVDRLIDVYESVMD